MIDYASRLDSIRAQMAERNIGLLFLPPGANLFYVTGVRRQEQGGTDHNAYADYVVGGYIGQTGGVTLLTPRMGGGYYRGEAQGKPWIEEVRPIVESEAPLDVLEATLKRFEPTGKQIVVDSHAWAQSLLALRKYLPGADIVMASTLLNPMRRIKNDEELALMRKAGEITEQAFAESLKRLKRGVTEIEIASEVDYQFKALGAEHTSFVTGIYFGGEGHGRSTVTGGSSRNTLQPGMSVMYDIGCVYEGYCSDFGRSAFCGEPPAEYLKIHDIILQSQRTGIEAMKAGQVTGAQVNKVARAVIEDAGYGDYFTHRLGHGIGITVHEPPWLDVVEQTVLQSNMTFTVEPSVIIPGRFGNRVEDIIAVTPNGGQSLYNADHRLYLVD
jgi:Xaa-Pro aminopeptidase